MIYIPPPYKEPTARKLLHWAILIAGFLSTMCLLILFMYLIAAIHEVGFN
jgi:hypothetical protein